MTTRKWRVERAHGGTGIKEDDAKMDRLRPRMMTVDEFKAMGYDRSRSEWALCYDAEGNRKPEDDMKILVGPICGGIRLKTRLTRWDQWRDRRWERKHESQGPGRDRDR